jgi:DNA-binding NarL/FixJ family response regulator
VAINGRSLRANGAQGLELPTVPTLSDEEWELITDAMSLTRRESDVVKLILRGLRDKQIASTLGVGLPTIRTHLRHIFAAQGVGDRAELILMVFALLRDEEHYLITND